MHDIYGRIDRVSDFDYHILEYLTPGSVTLFCGKGDLLPSVTLSRQTFSATRVIPGSFNLFSSFFQYNTHQKVVRMMKLLLAEDEKRMASALKELLKQEKYDVDHVADGAEALAALESGIYDAAVIDVMMPFMNGFDVVRNARSKGIRIPILLLTAKSALDDKVEGLDSGADDYLTKPFQTRELLARVRALCRRNILSEDGSLKYGDLSLDRERARLNCSTTGQSVRLGEKELRIMEYMIASQGRILTREQLAVKIWGFESEAEYNNVEVYMSFTRKKLAFVGSKTELKAVRGIGYELRYDHVS